MTGGSDGGSGARTAIRTHRLGRRFGSFTALRDLDLRVPSGAVFGFLGPNGAGKSTTIRLLLGLLEPSEGEVTVLGGVPGHEPALRSRIGALVEQPSVYPHLTARQNLELSRRVLDVEAGRVDGVFAEVGLRNAADRRVGGFSTGMRQRLGLGLALLGDPELLVLDEPTSGLDPSGIQEIRELILRMAAREGRTVFLSSHQLPEVQAVATHVGILAEGELRFQGTVKELDRLHRRATRIVVETDVPARAEDALSARGFEVVARDGNSLELRDPGDHGAVEEVARTLLDGDMGFSGLGRRKPSLEDLFFDVLSTEPER